VSVLVHCRFRGCGLAKAMVLEMIEIARDIGLEKLEAEFLGEQETAVKLFAMLGFSNLLRLDNYVKDMQANAHDYILMNLDLRVDEEYAGVGG
jgi:ribosomal protein S18 acetylase RimI-like enzyme